MGTYVWNLTKLECPDTLNRIYRGMMHFYVNSSTTASLENSIAVLNQGTQIAGLEVMQSFPLCAHTAWKTHMQGVIIVIHTDNYTSVAFKSFKQGNFEANQTRNLQEQETNPVHTIGVHCGK